MQDAANTLTDVPSWLTAADDSVRQSGSEIAVNRIEPDLIGLTLAPGIHVTAEHATLIRGQLDAVSTGARFGLLVHMGGVGSMDRNAMTGYVKGRTVTALALLGRTPVDRVLASWFLGIAAPQCPNRYFTDVHEALQWLRSWPKPGPEHD